MMNTPTQASGTQEEDLKVTVRGLMVWAAISIFLILVYALAASGQGFSKVVSIFSHGALIAIAFSKRRKSDRFFFLVFQGRYNRRCQHPLKTNTLRILLGVPLKMRVDICRP